MVLTSTRTLKIVKRFRVRQSEDARRNLFRARRSDGGQRPIPAPSLHMGALLLANSVSTKHMRQTFGFSHRAGKRNKFVSRAALFRAAERKA